MKAKKYWILAFVLLTSVLTLCLAGRAIPKTPQLEKDNKAETVYQHSNWYLDTFERYFYDGQLNVKETEVKAFLRLYSAPPAKRRDVLKGLHGVGVSVEWIKPEVEKRGLKAEALQTAIELRLRQHGIKVNEDGPRLYINVSTLLVDDHHCASIHVSVEFHERAILARRPKINTGVTTWQKGIIGFFGFNKLRDVRESVLELVDEFINDYLAANPKQQPTDEKDNKPKDD